MIDKQRFADSEHLKKQQYRNSDKLSARIRLHQNYSTGNKSLMAWIFDLMLDTAPKLATVLEIGTGRGDLWRENAHRIPEEWQLTLTDLSEGMLVDNQVYLSDLTKRMTYEIVNACHIPYADNSFDVVIAHYMLYHVPNRAQAIQEIRRVLKSDGVLFAATNGNKHMKMIYVLAGQIDEITEWETIFEGTFSLQNGTAQLMDQFSDIRMVQFHNNLWVTEAQPIIDYITSMVTIDGENIVREQEPEIRANLNRMIANEGGVLIEKETGLFIAYGEK